MAAVSVTAGFISAYAIFTWDDAERFLLELSAGLIVGSYSVHAQRHPSRRHFGIPLGWFLLGAAELIACTSRSNWHSAAEATGAVPVLLGVALGAGAVTNRQLHSPLEAGLFLAAVPGGFIFALYVLPPHLESLTEFHLPAAVICFVVSARALWVYRRSCFEQVIESSIWPFYRVRAVGPGMEQFPMTGPLLVIANHASYLDPIWMLKMLPRELTPMMYRRYFEWPVVHWFMAHVIRVIPVDAAYRHEVPELNEAVARLDRGEPLLLFPEGWVRRTEDVVVRRFGQGVWRILRERPATPVVACWIEGGWGSVTSFRGGPSYHNKRLDLRRPIDIAVAAPVVLDAETLADQRRARERLRALCVDARRYLGLPAVEITGEPGA